MLINLILRGFIQLIGSQLIEWLQKSNVLIEKKIEKLRKYQIKDFQKMN